VGHSEDLLEGFELHSPEKIRAAIAAGADAKEPIRGKRPIDCLIEMYLRSERFADCLRAMLEAGATVGDAVLEAILLDDDTRLGGLLEEAPHRLEKRFRLECAYTSLHGVSPLHVCAEFNSVKCARVLLNAGADVNAPAEVDAGGMGGQTAVFHAVNSNGNYCRPVMELLVQAGADLGIRLKGLVWGSGCEWETTIFDVTPISYAQCGLYFQFHRQEENVYSNIAYLWRKEYGSELKIRNVPNKYLDDARVFPPRR
jgi:Ankyrin repeats (3 copies)